MNKARFSKRPQKSPRAVEDIPEALRDSFSTPTQSRSHVASWLGGLLGLGAIALGAVIWYTLQPKDTSFAPSPVSASNPELKSSTKANTSSTETLLGHFAYSEAPTRELQPIGTDGQIKLRRAAAPKFQAMVAAARAKGVTLVPISGFRSIATQQSLFFDIKAQRGQVTTKRATVSAPPGYSEHHTGYAVDIGDGAVPATNLSTSFEKTRAFKWLFANAAHFSFEMSFPKNNSQGVSYEPWHWRFVGDRHSLETFYHPKSANSRQLRVAP